MNCFLKKTPPRRSFEKHIPVVLKLKDAYNIWQHLLPHVAKHTRQTLGAKIDSLLLEVLEETFRASYLSPQQKYSNIDTAIVRLDAVKFFVLVGWETGMLTDKQHIALSEPLVEASKMLAGWKLYLQKKTSADEGGRKS
ncbi:MAG TPA: four helix bundle protein [Candidatus Paceibacterota bacterium]